MRAELTPELEKRAEEGIPKRSSHKQTFNRIDPDVKAFAKMLTPKYARRIRHNPKMFKARVASLLKFHLPPYPRRGGRPISDRITRAVRLKLDTSPVI